MRTRIPILFAGFTLIWSLVILRAAQLQFLPNERLQARQERQFQTVVKLEARRAAVLDRKGRELALSVKTHSLYADPSKVEGSRWVAKKLAKVLKVSPESLQAKLKDRKKQFVWLARKLESEVRDAVEELGVPGLGFMEEYKRVYPNDSLLAPVLGMVGSEGQGLEGIELAFDSQLRGESKKMSVPRDARGRPLVMDGMLLAEVPEGQDVQLTIDSEIQNELEGELVKAVREFGADQAFGVVLDVASSEIVAMAMAPTFDANKAQKTSQEKRRHRSITDVFEPGSVIKTFAVAAAIEEGHIQPKTRINTEGGRFKVNDRWIKEADPSHTWANLTVPEILAFSSNVGTAKIAMLVGDRKLRSYLEHFGFGTKTGIELPGEQRGALLNLPWHNHLLSNISFGHGVSTTPLQVAAGYLAIANGGVWKKPKIVRALKDPDTGNMVPIVSAENTDRRVISPETAQAVRLMLTGVTAKGATGYNARVEGFLVAGKTGTAQKVDTKSGGYIQGAYISSFAGFLPANNPKYVIYVAVDHPKKTSYYGSQVAAPVFSRMAGYITRLEGWAPVLVEEKNLLSQDWKILRKGRKGKLSKMRPSEPAKGPSFTDTLPMEPTPYVPNLVNLTVREVLKKIEGQEVEVRLVGTGVVHDSWPRAGDQWSRKKQLTLFLRPQLKPRPIEFESRSGEEDSEGRAVHSF